MIKPRVSLFTFVLIVVNLFSANAQDEPRAVWQVTNFDITVNNPGAERDVKVGNLPNSARFILGIRAKEIDYDENECEKRNSRFDHKGAETSVKYYSRSFFFRLSPSQLNGLSILKK